MSMMSNIDKRTIQGMLLAVFAGNCWGSMAVAAQYLMQGMAFTVESLTTMRLFAAGIVMVLVDRFCISKFPLSTVLSKENAKDIIIYGITVFAIQWSFFQCIHYANAATAGILILTSPLFVVALLAIGEKRTPLKKELIAMTVAMIGVVCLVTKGRLDAIDFSILGISWGLSAAFFGAYSTVQPRKVMARLSVTTLVGWGMLIGGVASALLTTPFEETSTWNAMTIGCYAYIVIFGTIIAFWCYMKSLEFVPPSTTSILNSFEPLSAVVFSIIVFGLPFGTVEIIGTLLIFSTVFILMWKK